MVGKTLQPLQPLQPLFNPPHGQWLDRRFVGFSARVAKECLGFTVGFSVSGMEPGCWVSGCWVLRWVFILVLPSKKKSTYDSKTKHHRFPWNIFAKSRWVWWVECWHGAWFAVNGCSFGVFYFHDSHTNKYNRNLKISSELCPLIHDRNHVWSAIKIAKDRGIQAFDGLRTLVVSLTRSHIF